MAKSILQKSILNLVKIPSYVEKDVNEGVLIDHIEKVIESETDYNVVSQPVEGKRRNLIIKGNIPPKLILFGHTDTVIPKSKNSLKPRVENNKLYGLGAVDMKAGVAIMLEQLKNYPSSLGLCVILTVDEEYDFKGAEKLISKYNFSPKYLINLEPTDLKILQGCRGVTEFSFEVYGKTAHAGRKELGLNAIEITMAIYRDLDVYLSKQNKKSSGKSTLNVAYINGGVITSEKNITCAANIVPNYAKSVAEVRIANSKITQKVIKDCLSTSAKNFGVKIKNLNFKFYLGSMYTERDELVEFESVLKECGEKVEYGNINKSGYFEVQMLTSKWKSSTFIYGPGPKDTAHTENEFVDLIQVEKANKVIGKFIGSILNV